MTFSRREFVAMSTAFGLLSSASEEAMASSDVKGLASQSTFGETYWSSLYAADTDPSRGPARHMTAQERVPAIYFNDPNAKTQELRPSYDIKDAELPNFIDEAVVTMELSGFRPGTADKEALSQVNFANMHLSCQRISGSEFIGPIAWATIASVFSNKAKSLPAVSALDWSTMSGQQAPKPADTTATAAAAQANPRIQHLLLSHGAGKLSVNVTTTPKKSALDKVLTVCLNASTAVAPLFGFPAISTLALGAFYDFYGKIEAAAKDNFLLSTTRQDVVVAQQGLNVAELDVHPLHLLSGDYILVPALHQADFEKAMSNLTPVNGMLVERSSTGALADRVQSAIPGISYLVLSVKVQSASQVAETVGITDPVLGDHGTAKPSAGTSSSSGSNPSKQP